MAVLNAKIAFMCVTLLAIALAVRADDGANNYLDVDTPTFFNYNSPLRQPESLRSRPYFDFLSTLYRRDADKSSLFNQYNRNRRAADTPVAAPATGLDPIAVVAHVAAVEAPERPKRALVFRPLFVYRQQQVRREKIAAERKRRV